MTELFCGEELAGAIDDLRAALVWAGGLLESGYFMCSAIVCDETLGTKINWKTLTGIQDVDSSIIFLFCWCE
jgi:hypothetical protein